MYLSALNIYNKHKVNTIPRQPKQIFIIGFICSVTYFEINNRKKNMGINDII